MNSRRYFLQQSALAATGIAIANPFNLFAQPGSAFFGNNKRNCLTLLHTNDLHNLLNPVSYESYSQLGGFENTVRVISKLKKENSNVLLLDAGDIFNGNINHQQEQETTIKIMQAAGYDAVVLGNRDYETGFDYLQQQWQKNNTSLIAGNYTFGSSAVQSLHQPYKIIYKGNLKIGITAVGINMNGLVAGVIHRGVNHKDPVSTLNSIARYLKKEEKCDMVVCLSHLGYKNIKAIDDISLAKQTQNVDVIIGGHSHTFMSAPAIVLNKNQQEVIINHAGFGGIALGNMTISFDDYGNKTMVDFNNRMIGTENNNWEYNRAAVVAA